MYTPEDSRFNYTVLASINVVNSCGTHRVLTSYTMYLIYLSVFVKNYERTTLYWQCMSGW
jgi:hypothetical protein